MARNYEVSIDGLAVRLVQHGTEDAAPAPGLWLNAPGPGDVPGLIARARKVAGAAQVTIAVPDVEAAWEAFARTYKRVEAAGGAVSDEQGRLLAIHRLGRWDLPKGKVDEGEAVEEAAVREVMEECGLRDVERGAHLCATWHTYVRKGERHLKRTDWYRMRASSRQPLIAQSEEDITEVRWLAPAEVEAMKAETYPSLLPVIAAWQAGT